MNGQGNQTDGGDAAAQARRFATRSALQGRSLRRHTARGTIINGAFLVGLNTLGLMRGFLLAGFLATDDYGVWGVLSVAVAGLFWFKDVGVPDKFVQQDEDDQELAFQKAFTMEAAMTSIFTVIVALAIPLIAIAYGEWKIVAPALATLLACPAVVLQTPVWVHYRQMEFARQRTLQAIDPVLGFAVMVPLAVYGFGYWSLVIGTVAGAWAAAFVCVLKSPYPLRLRYDKGTLREYYRFSWPLFLGQGARFLNVQVYLLTGTRVLGLAGVGYVTLASQISNYTNKVDQILASTMYPAVCAVRDRKDLLFESFVKSNRLALLWGIPFGVGVALFAGDIVHFGIGAHWLPAVPIISVFGLIAAINHLAYNWDDYFRALNDTKPIAIWAWANLATTLLVTLPLLITLHLDGFAIGMTVNTLVSLAIRVHFLTRLFPGFEMLRHAARAIAPTIPAADAVLIMRLLSMHHHRTVAMALVEIVSFVLITVVATAALERSLVREVLGYLRPAAVPQVSGAA
jgi:O-antigen/teichoic acid export membrane protein